MTTAVAKAVAQGVLNLPVDFQPPPADGANQADGCGPGGRADQPGGDLPQPKPASWNVTPKPDQPPSHPSSPPRHPTREPPNPPIQNQPSRQPDPTSRRSRGRGTTAPARR